MTDEEILAQAFLKQGTAIERAQASSIAHDVLAENDELARSALEWARTGTMPTWPEIQGYTPAHLATRKHPTNVFTALLYLRDKPEEALGVLSGRHLPPPLKHDESASERGEA